MDTIKQVIFREIDDCTYEQRVSMKKTEVNSLKSIIVRRDKMIKEYLSIGRACKFLIESTNSLRRELTVAEAELRQLEKGIVMN